MDGVGVQVKSVSLGPIETVEGRTKKLSLGKYLVIRLRAQQVPRSDDHATLPRRWTAFPDVRLTDESGQDIPTHYDADVAAAGFNRIVSHSPVESAEEVFTFKVPAPTSKALRLEVKAEAYGGTGVFRFTIPRSMIHAGPVRGGAAPKASPAG